MLNGLERIYPEMAKQKPPDEWSQMFVLAWVSLWAWLSVHLSG